VSGSVSSVIGVVEMGFLVSIDPRVTTIMNFPARYLCQNDLTASPLESRRPGVGDRPRSGDPVRDNVVTDGIRDSGVIRPPQLKCRQKNACSYAYHPELSQLSISAPASAKASTIPSYPSTAAMKSGVRTTAMLYPSACANERVTEPTVSNSRTSL
jgi:hypothetical protein